MALPGNVPKQQAPLTQADKFARLKEQIKPIQQATSKYHAALYYGKSKTGKTTLACSYPKPLLLVDICEKGSMSVSNIEGVDLLSLQSWDDLELLYQYLKYGDHNYQTVVLDTVTNAQDEALKNVVTSKSERTNRTITDKKTQGDWGDAAILMKVWMQYYRDLCDKMNVVFLAQYREDEKESFTTEQIMPNIGPALMPSVAEFLGSAVSIIGWVHIAEITKPDAVTKLNNTTLKHCVLVSPHNVYKAGIRSFKGVKYNGKIEDPTYEKIAEILNKTN